MTSVLVQQFNPPGEIALDVLKRRLALVTTVAEAKTIRDEAETLRGYAKQAHMGLATQNRVARLKILAERHAGELLAALEKSVGGRPQKTPAVAAGVSPYRAALVENHIPDRTAEKWQCIARWIDEDTIQAMYSECEAQGEEFTSTVVYDRASWARFEASSQQLPARQHPDRRRLGQGLFRGKSLAQQLHMGRVWSTDLRIHFDTDTQRAGAARRLDRVACDLRVGRPEALLCLLDCWEQHHTVDRAAHAVEVRR